MNKPVIVAVFGLTVAASGSELPRLTNAGLAPQIAGDQTRILPQSSLLSLATNFHAFYRVADGYPGYYHGGYWMDSFAELRPMDKFAINGRLIFYNPAYSYGVLSSSYLHPLISICWTDNLKNYGMGDVKVVARVMDLDRQTLGAGLTLEDKEMSAANIELQSGIFRLRYLQDGTGGYDIGGDVHYLQADILENLFGLYTFDYHEGRRAFSGAYSMHRLFDWLSYRIEASNRNGANAGLAGVTLEKNSETLQASLDYQIRAYQSGFATDIKQHIQHDYLSIDQEDKPFTDSMNIFVVDDNVVAHAIRLRVSYEPTKWLRLSTDNELASIHYAAAGTQNRYFYRHRIGICPLRANNACGYLVYSNKISNAKYPLYWNDDANKFSFAETQFVGLEARIRF